MQTLTNATPEALDVESVAYQLAALPTDELIDLAMIEPGWNPLMAALVDRLEHYAEELERLEDELRAAGRLPRKQPGKVVDLSTRRTLV